jgi:uncharacterized membrane protein YdbT with pleckstrin-like domain
MKHFFMIFKPSSLNLVWLIPASCVLVGLPSLVSYLTTSYELQDGILEEKKGLFFKKSISIPVSNIDNIKVEYFGFFRNIGKLIVETPGESQNEILTNFWIDKPDEIRKTILTA